MERLVSRAASEAADLSPTEKADFDRRFANIRAKTSSQAEPARKRSQPQWEWPQPPPKPRRTQEEMDAAWARKQADDQRARAERAKAEADKRAQEEAAERRRRTEEMFRRREPPKVTSYARFQDGTSNKVYGIIERGNEFFTFWGRYGSSLSTKRFDSHYEASEQFRSKIKKGYKETTISPITREWIIANVSF